MEDLLIEEKSILHRSTESREFDRLAGEVMRSISTGTTNRKQEFGEEELVEDLLIEEKNLLDTSTESSEFHRMA